MNKSSFVCILLIGLSILSLKSFSQEKLKYLMYYGWFDGGYASLNLNPIDGKENNVHAYLEAKSTGITDRLYKVRDIYESFFSTDDFLTTKAIRNISEGKYKYYNEAVFNRQDTTVISQKSGIIKVPENTIDMLAAFYKLRNILITEGIPSPDTMISIQTFFGDTLFKLQIRYVKKERIKLDKGYVDCIKFSPVTEVGRVFKTEDDMSIWFSDDKNMVPIRVKFDLFIGSINCDLIENDGLKYPIHFY